MRPAIAAAALALALAPAAARAQPPEDEVHGLVSVSFGTRGNQGGLLEGGFRLMVAATLLTPIGDVGLMLDRQIGADNRVVDPEGDAARWSEWVAALRLGRRQPLAKGLRAQAVVGLALVRTRVTGPVDVPAALIDDGLNLAGDAGVGLVWHSGVLAVTLAFGLTLVPSAQRLVVDRAAYVLPSRVEPWMSLGFGYTL